MVSRRKLLRAGVIAAGALAGGTWVAHAATAPPAGTNPSAAATPSPGRVVNRVRVRSRQSGTSHLAVTWRNDGNRLRLGNEQSWGEWTPLDSCDAAPDDRPTDAHHAVLTAEGATRYGMVGDVEAVEFAAVGPSAADVAAAAVFGMPLPDGSTCPVTYLSRAAWGADESKRFSGGVEVWPAEWYPVQVLTVHHTAGNNNDPTPAATIRAIYNDQAVSQGWGDIGYHLLIDEAGQVYEGRWTGTDGVPIFGNGPTGMMVNTAGHASGYNTGNIGVCLLGNFTSQGPTAAAREALVTVLADLARVCHIGPSATINYFNPVNQQAKSNFGVSGHRDWNNTQCPGNTFYPSFDELRQLVVARMPRDRSEPSTPSTPEDGRTPPSVPSAPTPTPTGRTRP